MKRTFLATLGALALSAPALAGDVLKSADQRFADENVKETPSFQRHVLPLMGQLGCNGRACHGSFQGQGGFRLSLFGYDFKADHDALLKGDNPRVDTESATDSLILEKSTLGTPHKGGKRLELGSWQYRIIEKWVEAGAKPVGDDDPHFVKLEVTPSEIVFKKAGEMAQIKVVAHWSDGTVEDVTPLCRYRTNDESLAEIDADGRVKSLGKGDTHVVAFYDNGVVPTQVILPVSDKVGKKYPNVSTPTKIDELVVEKLRKLGAVPSDLANDAEFLRRVTLDITGTLPTPPEIEAFLADTAADKRTKKIDELLERPAYAAWMATLLCDQTGNNARLLNGFMQGNGFNRQISGQWYDWIHRRVKDNVSYDTIVAGMVVAASRLPGQSYEDYLKDMTSYFSKSDTVERKDPADRETMPYFWAKQNVRKADEAALAFSHTFLGVRLQCAQCHKHPFDQWTQQDFNQFSAFFGRMQLGTGPGGQQLDRELQEKYGLRDQAKNQQERQRILTEALNKGELIPWREVFVRPATNPGGGKGQQVKGRPQQNQRVTPKVLGGEEVVEQLDDPRQAIMDWMREKENPYFARAFVNRTWARLFGVGIIEPADDMNLANPPANEALLDHLTEAFIEHGFDMKWLQREITNSRTYQLSWQPNDTNKFDSRNFSHAQVRRLPAEVAYDAILYATASADRVKTLQEDPKSRAIADQNTDRRQRNNGTAYALGVFGQPERATACDCERSTEPSLSQSLYLMNDADLFTLMDRKEGRLAELGRQVADASKPAGGEKQNEKGDRRNRKQFADRIQQAERQIKQLKEEGKTDEAAKLERKLAAVRQELKAVEEKSSRETEPATATAPAAASVNTDELVREMYLRTLSRFPSDAEMSKAREYLTEAKDPVSGVRDVLWALLNTKEFIVNH